MDVEGAEYDALFQTPKRCFQRIRRIALEYHPTALYSGQDVVVFLEKLGFEVWMRKKPDMIYAFRKDGAWK